MKKEFESFEVVFLGETGVGKTSLITQLVDRTFQKDQVHESSFRMTLSTKQVICENKILKFEIWDIEGLREYSSSMNFIKSKSAIILVYDITRKDSFEELQNYWAEKIKNKYTDSETILAIVANKSDLNEYLAVDEETARYFAQSLGAIFVNTTATKAEPINNLFIQIAEEYTGSNIIKILEKEDELELESYKEKENSIKLTRDIYDRREHRYPKC